MFLCQCSLQNNAARVSAAYLKIGQATAAKKTLLTRCSGGLCDRIGDCLWRQCNHQAWAASPLVSGARHVYSNHVDSSISGWDWSIMEVYRQYCYFANQESKIENRRLTWAWSLVLVWRICHHHCVYIPWLKPEYACNVTMLRLLEKAFSWSLMLTKPCCQACWMRCCILIHNIRTVVVPCAWSNPKVISTDFLN